MSKQETGGQAFPGPFTGHCGNESHAEPCGCYVEAGMTLRDYFAAQALPAIVAGCVELGKKGEKTTHSMQAKAAYLLADEMLKARLE